MHIAICDDNINDLKAERIAIEDVLKEKNMKYSISEYTNAQGLINTDKNFDIIFLDIEMEGTNGLGVAKAIHEKNKKCLVFFVTNYEHYMDDAMDEYAFRFWVKPLDRQRLKRGIESAIKRINNNNKVIEININRQKQSIEIQKIIYISAEKGKTRIITTDGEFITREAFKTIKEMINSYFFYEPHTSFYVNLNYVTKYTKTSVICEYNNKEYEIYMSRRKYTEFNKYFIDWMGEQI